MINAINTAQETVTDMTQSIAAIAINEKISKILSVPLLTEFDPSHSADFLKALVNGDKRDDIHIRAIPPRLKKEESEDLEDEETLKEKAENTRFTNYIEARDGIRLESFIGRGLNVYYVVNGGGTTKYIERWDKEKNNGKGGKVRVTDENGNFIREITKPRAIIWEMDERSKEDQLRVFLESPLGHLDFIVIDTGGKSLHFIILINGGTIEEWEDLQTDLGQLLPMGDQSLNDSPQIMRLPGCPHQKYGRICTVINWTETRYNFTEIRNLVPKLAKKERETLQAKEGKKTRGKQKKKTVSSTPSIRGTCLRRIYHDVYQSETIQNLGIDPTFVIYQAGEREELTGSDGQPFTILDSTEIDEEARDYQLSDGTPTEQLRSTNPFSESNESKTSLMLTKPDKTLPPGFCDPTHIDPINPTKKYGGSIIEYRISRERGWALVKPQDISDEEVIRTTKELYQELLIDSSQLEKELKELESRFNLVIEDSPMIGKVILVEENIKNIFRLENATDLAYFNNSFHCWTGKLWLPLSDTGSFENEQRDLHVRQRVQDALWNYFYRVEDEDGNLVKTVFPYAKQESVNEAIKSLKTHLYIHRPNPSFSIDDLDCPAIYNHQNGVTVIDKDGDRFISHEESKSLYLTSILLWDRRDDETDYTMVMKLFDAVAEEDKDRFITELAIGLEPYHTSQYLDEWRLVAIINPYGASAKGVISQTMRLIHGASLVSHVDIEAYRQARAENNNKSCISGVEGKRINIGNETAEKFRPFGSEDLKNDITHDVRQFKILQVQPHPGRFKGKHFFFSNHEPVLDSVIEYAIRRFCPISMPYTFKKEGDFDPSNPIHKLADKRFKDGEFLLDLIPSLFNLLLNRRRGLMTGKVKPDYSHVKPYFENIAKTCKHLRRIKSEAFVEDKKSIIPLSSFWTIYQAWLIVNQYAIGNVRGNDGKVIIAGMAYSDGKFEYGYPTDKEPTEDDVTPTIDYSLIKEVIGFKLIEHPNEKWDRAITRNRDCMEKIRDDLKGIVTKAPDLPEYKGRVHIQGLAVRSLDD